MLLQQFSQQFFLASGVIGVVTTPHDFFALTAAGFHVRPGQCRTVGWKHIKDDAISVSQMLPELPRTRGYAV